MADVVLALYRVELPRRASQLDIPGTVQAISSALRHAKDRGLVIPRPIRPQGSLWSLTQRGREAARRTIEQKRSDAKLRGIKETGLAQT